MVDGWTILLSLNCLPNVNQRRVSFQMPTPFAVHALNTWGCLPLPRLHSVRCDRDHRTENWISVLPFSFIVTIITMTMSALIFWFIFYFLQYFCNRTQVITVSNIMCVCKILFCNKNNFYFLSWSWKTVSNIYVHAGSHYRRQEVDYTRLLQRPDKNCLGIVTVYQIGIIKTPLWYFYRLGHGRYKQLSILTISQVSSFQAFRKTCFITNLLKNDPIRFLDRW